MAQSPGKSGPRVYRRSITISMANIWLYVRQYTSREWVVSEGFGTINIGSSPNDVVSILEKMPIFLALLLFAQYHHSSCARPILDLRDASPSMSCSPMRSQFGVLWTCLTTMCLCGWSAVRPNAPTPRGWPRVKLMLWAIVLPEFILAWAARQWFAAREIRNEYNAHKAAETPPWTMLHGHFLVMGGFTFIDRHSNSCLGVFSFGSFKTLIQNPNFHFPAYITENYLRSRFQSTDTITIVQLAWSVLQLIARRQQGLAIMETELLALSVIFLTSLTRFLWFYKPLDVWHPMEVYVDTDSDKDAGNSHSEVHATGVPDCRCSEEHKRKTAATQIQILFASEVLTRIRKVVESIINAILVVSFGLRERGPFVALYGLFIVFPICILLLPLVLLFSGFPFAISFLSARLEPDLLIPNRTGNRGLLVSKYVLAFAAHRIRLASYTIDFFATNLRKVTDTSLPFFLFFWFVLSPAIFIFLFFIIVPFIPIVAIASFLYWLLDDSSSPSTLPGSATHVPTFYTPTTKCERHSRFFLHLYVGIINAVLFCIGWNFTFPSQTELIVWRALSITLIVIPFGVGFVGFGLQNAYGEGNTFFQVVYVTQILLIWVYVAARLSLYLLALELLRQQPPSAFQVVDWAKYLPHLG